MMRIFIFADWDHSSKWNVIEMAWASYQIVKNYKGKKEIIFLTEIFQVNEYNLIGALEREKRWVISDPRKHYWPFLAVYIKNNIKIYPISPDDDSLYEQYELKMVGHCLKHVHHVRNKDVVIIINIGADHVKAFKKYIKRLFSVSPEVFHFIPYVNLRSYYLSKII